MRYRVVIKDLRKPAGPDNRVKIGGDLSRTEAAATQKRFAKLKWDERRPGVLTIDHIALCVEPDVESDASGSIAGD